MSNFTLPFSFTLPTKIVYGPGCIVSLIDELQLNNGNKPVIITDKGVKNAGILDKITSLLAQNNISCTVYDGVEPKDRKSVV